MRFRGNLAGPPQAFLERRWWADAPMNGGYYPFADGALTQPERVAPAWPEGSHMNARVTVTVKVDVAAILLRLAAIIALLT